MRAPPITASRESVCLPYISSIKCLTYLETKLNIKIP